MRIIILGFLFMGCTANQSINPTKHIEAIISSTEILSWPMTAWM